MSTKFIKTREKIEKAKTWFQKNEKYLSIAFFTGGFILDNLTLTRIDLIFDNIVLISYLFLATLSIVLINFFQNKKESPNWVKYIPLLTQFTLGGLFSGYVIFYTKSATWASSWIFLLLIYLLFIANERFRKYYEKIDFQIIVLFVAVFSFLIFFLPTVLKEIGSSIFILSGLFSLLIIYLLILFLSKFISPLEKKKERRIIGHIFLIYFVFNLMYFLNIIPPVPLSLKEIGVYQSVSKNFYDDYLLKEFEQPWYQFGNYFIKIPVGTVYVYNSVFAPTDLDTKIVNVWYKYDEKAGKWFSMNTVTYPIRGGRGEGYRGYSLVTNVDKGNWRVDITNEKGQVLGRVKFEVVEQ